MNKVQSQSTSTEGRPGRKKMQWGQQERDSRRNCICSKFEPCPEDARSPLRHANSRLPSSLPEWRNLYVEYGGGLANPGEKILQEKNSKQSPWLSDGQDPELGWYHGTVLLLRVSSRRQRGHKKSSLCLAGRHTSSISHPSALVLLPAACDYVIASQCFPPKLLLLPGPQEAPPRNFLAPVHKSSYQVTWFILPILENPHRFPQNCRFCWHAQICWLGRVLLSHPPHHLLFCFSFTWREEILFYFFL